MSRRFSNRHAKVVADPAALPVAAVVLDDSNSYVDVTQPDRRVQLTLNSRAFVQAGENDAQPVDYVEAPPAEPDPLARLGAFRNISQLSADERARKVADLRAQLAAFNATA